MPLLTLSMIVKNEEKYLRDCLESVKGVADEIIIVDTGSTDRTIEIAKEYNASIFNFQWIDDFAAARNFALKHSTGDYILYLDADERLSENSIGELKKILRQGAKGAFNCTVNNIDTVNGKPNIMRYTRLFKNHRKLEFRGCVHEQIIDSINELGYKIIETSIEIIHIGYNIPPDKIKEKAARNLVLLLKDYRKKPDNPYTVFQLAQTYNVVEEKENAIKYFTRVLQFNNCPTYYKAHSYRYLAAYEQQKHNYTAALDYALKGLKYNEGQPLLNVITAKILQKMNRHAEAVKYAVKAYEANHLLVTGQKMSDFDILIEEMNLLYFGLHVSILAADKNAFNYFYQKLIKTDYGKSAQNGLIMLMNSLLNNKPVDTPEAKKAASAISPVNLDFILALMKSYSHTETKIAILEEVSPEVRKLSSYLNYYGIILLEQERFADAGRLLEMSLKAEDPDPSSVFYLISLYVTTGDYGKIPALVSLAEREFSYLPEVSQRLQMLKERLAAILT